MSEAEEDPVGDVDEVLSEDEAGRTEGGTEGEDVEGAEAGASGEAATGEGEGEVVERGEDTSQPPEEGADAVSGSEEIREEETKEGSDLQGDEEEEGDWGEEEWGEEDEDEEEEGEMGPAVLEAARFSSVSPAVEVIEHIAKKVGAGKGEAVGLDDLEDAGGLAAVEVAVLVAATTGDKEEVPDEDRTRYVWEGPCSSSSEEDVKKRKRRRWRGEEEEEEEEWEEEEEELEDLVYSREDCLEEYRSLLAQRPFLIKKNMLLQKKIYEYCKKRKMEVYFEEVDCPDPKMLVKYQRQLEAFDEHLQDAERSRDAWHEQLQKLEEHTSERTRAMEQALQQLLDAERAVGAALLSATTGKPLPDKAVEKLLQRQENLAMELHGVRLRFIRLRNDLAVSEALLKRLETETLGEGLHLLDYEQLRMENQSYSDKIEERDEELTRLRNKATGAIQQLAHIREKANATAVNIAELYDRLEKVDEHANEAREFMGLQKIEREALRVQYQALRKDAGLLVHKRLLRDFERSLVHSDELAVELTNLKEQHARQHKRLTRVKETLKEVNKELQPPAGGVSRRLKGEPSLYDVYRAMMAERRQSRLSEPEVPSPSAEPRMTRTSIKRVHPGSSLFESPHLLYSHDKRRPTK